MSQQTLNGTLRVHWKPGNGLIKDKKTKHKTMKKERLPFRVRIHQTEDTNIRRCVGVAVRSNSGERTVRKCSSLLGIQSQLSFKVIRSAQSLGICPLLHTRAITLNSDLWSGHMYTPPPPAAMSFSYFPRMLLIHIYEDQHSKCDMAHFLARRGTHHCNQATINNVPLKVSYYTQPHN